MGFDHIRLIKDPCVANQNSWKLVVFDRKLDGRHFLFCSFDNKWHNEDYSMY